MRVGSRGDYGIRAVAFLAANAHQKKPVQVHTIAERQQIPEDYLRQLLVTLRTAGIVKSIRGPHGGYLLAVPPEEITMGKIIEVLEGAPDQMRCAHFEDGVPPCDILAGCRMRAHWAKATQGLLDVLHRTTLADLIADGDGPS